MTAATVPPAPAATARPSLWERETDGTLALNFHQGQAAAWRANERFVFVLAGSQGGKTSFGPWWLAREIQRCGSGDYLAATASYDLFKLKMLPALRECFETMLGLGTYHASDRVITLSEPEGTRIILRSAVSGGGLESATAKAAWLDECGQEEFTVQTLEAVMRRLALHQGRILGTTTPYNVGYLKTDVYDRWAVRECVCGHAGDEHDAVGPCLLCACQQHECPYSVINFSSTINPSYPKAEFERARATTPAWRFNMFYRGLFERPAGLIYDAFRDEHVVDDFDIPASWPRYVGLDFGGVNHAMIWVAVNPLTTVAYAYRESLTPNLTTAERAKAAKEYAARENVVGWYGGAPSEGQQRMDWRHEGVDVRRPLVADLEAGIDRVTALIKLDRFRVFKSLKGLRDELGSYRRKLNDRGEPTMEIVDKRTFHHLDGLRYVAPALSEPEPSVPVVGGSQRFTGQAAIRRSIAAGTRMRPW